MKANIHPKWFAEATVVCACGNTWKTGATIPEIRTDICSACHPFYTGEQRIVDTEGQVDRFMKRLQVRDNKRAETDARKPTKPTGDLPIADLGINKRYVTLLSENGINTVDDVLAKLSQGDDALIAIQGLGRQTIAEIKKALRTRGYEVPTADAV